MSRNAVPKRISYLNAVSAFALLCCAESAAAQDIDPFSLSPEQLFDAMVVSASRTPERLGDAPAAAYVLTSEDIARSGATSIADALRLVPGVQVARVDASTWAISVRGFRRALANKLLVLIDGREVYDPLFSGVYWDIQDMVLADIERIEVIRGPGATLWGANAVNGVINIITKSASETHGVHMSALAGTFDRAIVEARVGGAAGENFHWRLFGKYSDRAATNNAAGTDMEDEWRAWRGGVRLDWAPIPGDTVTFTAGVYNSESGQLRAVPQFTAPYAVVEEEEIAARGANFLGRWARELGDDSRFSVQSYLNFSTRKRLNLDDDRTTFDFEAQYELPQLARHKITIGGRYRQTNVELGPTELISATNTTLNEQLFSGFVQDKIMLAPENWFLTLGSKFDVNDFTGFEIQPTARLQWLGVDQSAWASVSRAVRMPSELENDLHVWSGVIPPGLFPLPVSVELVPSMDFESETMIAYEAGYRRQWSPNFLTDFAVFYNEYDGLATLSLQPPDIIFTPPARIVLPILTTNLTQAATYGGEAVASWRAAENFNLSAAYSFLHLELDGPPSDQAIDSEAGEDDSPRHQFNLRAQWDVRENVSFDTILYFVGAIPGFSLDAQWRLDMRLGWRLTDHLELELVGQNLLQESQREFGDANSAVIDRAIYGRLAWRN